MYILRKCSSDPVLLKPSLNTFIDVWNGKDFSRNSSTSSYTGTNLTGEPIDELLLKFSDLEFAQIPKDISRRERMKLEKKVQRNVRRRHSILVANKCQFQEPLSRFRSLSDLKSTTLSSPTKRVSFSIEQSRCDVYDSDDAVEELANNSRRSTIQEWTEVKLKPILVKRDRALSVPLEHMDVVMFDAFKRGSKVSMEVQMDFIRSHRKKAARRTQQKGWSNPADLLKSLVLQCLSSRRNRTSPSDILCPFTAVETTTHHRALIV